MIRRSCSATCPNPVQAIGLALCLGTVFASGFTPGMTVLAAAHAEENPVLRIADVQRLPRALAKGKHVTVGGVVAWIQLPDHSRLTIQEGQRGMWIAATDPLPKSPAVWQGSNVVLESLEPGDEVEIEGLLDPGGFAPKLLARDIRVVGRVPVPMPIEIEDGDFFTGGFECCRIAVTGIVQGYRYSEGQLALLLERNGRRFEALVPRDAFPSPATQLVDAPIRLVGTTNAAFNARGELLYPRVRVMHASDITVLAPPPCPPFAVPSVPLPLIGGFRPEPTIGHRLRTEGTINYLFPGGFYLQDGAVGIRVETAQPTTAAVDDRVEVAGFLDRRRHAVGMHQALVRVLRKDNALATSEVTPADIVRHFQDARLGGTMATPGDYDGCLVTFSARVADIERTPAGGRFLLSGENGGPDVVVRMDEPTFANLAAIRIGSMLRVTGLLQIEASTPTALWSELTIDNLVVGLRSAADVAILETPSWWTARRLASLVAALAAVVAGALVWVALLRRQVTAQAARIADELKTRHDAALEFQATLRERSRLAANLHDTILQTLAGALLQIDVCRHLLAGDARPTGTSDDDGQREAMHQLDVTKRMVRHAADDLRGSVWALRTQPIAGRSFSESLEAIVQHFSRDGHDIALMITGTPFRLPKFIAGNMLLVIQETIRNAVKHAHAADIAVAVNYDHATRTVTATVRDDGVGFDAANAAGPEQGHFGLQGMRERMAGLGGDLFIDTATGHGTTISARVTVTDLDDSLDDSIDPHDATAVGSLARAAASNGSL